MIEPVIADRKAGAHFSGIQEMIGIPVLEIACRLQLCIGALRIFFITENIVCQSQCGHTALDSFGCFKQPDAVRDLILTHRLFQRPVRFAAELLKQDRCHGIIADMCFQLCKFLLRHDNARMRVHAVFFDHIADDLFAVGEFAAAFCLRTAVLCKRGKRHDADYHDRHKQYTEQPPHESRIFSHSTPPFSDLQEKATRFSSISRL